MSTFYTRREKIEEKRNIRSAFIFSFLSLMALIAFIFLGLPTVVKISGFLLGFKKSSQQVDTNDTTPPSPPRIEPLPSTTNNPNQQILGNTEEGATVTLLINGRDNELIADNEGKFSYSFSLKDGENTISASAKDPSGNESQPSETIKIIFDNQPPDLEISKPQDKSQFVGARQRQIVIEGKTEEGASVNINGRQVVVETDGNFSLATTLADGENSFTIKSQDKAGNSTEKSLTLTFSP